MRGGDRKSLVDGALSVSQTLVIEGISVDFFDGAVDCLVFVRRGQARVAWRLGEFVVKERQALLLPRGTEASLAARGGPLIVVSVRFARDALFAEPAMAAFFAELLSRWRIDRPVALADAGQTADMMGALRQMVREQGGDARESALDLRARFFALVAALSRRLDKAIEVEATDIRARRFRPSLRYIEDHIGGDLRIADLARVAGVSYRRYTQMFKREMGTTVLAHLRALRVQLAKERLLETGEVLQASLDSGFADLSNFYRVFRAETGMTPKQYIGRNGGNSPIITL
jgi:AraC-like DNA-binding protein